MKFVPRNDIIESQKKNNDIIIGKVIDITPNGWRIEFNSAYTILDLEYAQYVKTNFDFHQTHFLSGKMSWAYRVAGGIIVPYGNSALAPIA